jgi:hypothetical protein
MWLLPLAGTVLAIGIVLAWLVFAVLFRAVSNLFDWAVLTFGNESSVADLRCPRGRY